MEAIDLTLPPEIATGPVSTTYIRTASKGSDLPPMLLVHGFDISCMEYRRLLPLLEEAGIEAYAPCIAGWGFTDTANMKSVGVEAKRAQLLAFQQEVLGGRPAIWVGASLGACTCLDVYKTSPEAVHSVATLDPGFFTDPPPAVPAFIGRLLLQNVLSQLSVRESIAKQAYCVKEDQTVDGRRTAHSLLEIAQPTLQPEPQSASSSLCLLLTLPPPRSASSSAPASWLCFAAIAVGNLHIDRAKWEDDSLEWLLGGAYGDIAPSVAKLDALPTLTLWGRQDEVIPPAGLGAWPAAKLVGALPSGQFRWVEDSGHTPHLEQPAFTAAALAAFARGEVVQGDADVKSVVQQSEMYDAVLAKANELGGAAKERLIKLWERQAS